MNKISNRKKLASRSTNPVSKVVRFEQEANYYYLKGRHYLYRNKPSKAGLFFRKAIEIEPGNPLHHYNLACLLSKTNRFEEANRIFKNIVDQLEPEMTECFFLMAINCGLLDDLETARDYLQKYVELSPEGEMAEEALDLIFALEEEENLLKPVARMTPQENERLLQIVLTLDQEELARKFARDDGFKVTLLQGLYQGSDRLKEEIIYLYGRVGRPAVPNLRQYVMNPWIKERFRQMALLVLKNFSPTPSCRIYREGFIEVDLNSYPIATPVWKQHWQQVLRCTLNHMRQSSYYAEEFYEDVLAIWLDFIDRVYPEVPRIVKPQTWAAGLEYSLSRFHFLNITQKDLAVKYGVSTSSVGAKYKAINQALQIDKKAYRNMLSILTKQG
ncbi:MAG: tetratricopeptide repeat protein [Firmicutes bacterium]|nr:tetratricopeptide repeat protein [Bacillota bacterium]